VSTNKKRIIKSKVVMWGSRDPNLQFVDPLISRKRLKLETSNLTWRRRAESSNEKNSKLGQKGSCGGHVPNFGIFGHQRISREHLKLKSSNFAKRLMSVSSN